MIKMITTTITNFQRGLLYENGNFIKVLLPGKYREWSYSDRTIEVYDVNEAFQPDNNLNVYSNDPQLNKELKMVTISDSELCLHFEDGLFKEVLTTGKYAYWTVLIKHEFVMVDLTKTSPETEIDPSILMNKKLEKYIISIVVSSQEWCILSIDGIFHSLLEAGKYYFWRGTKNLDFVRVDKRQQQLEINGQELMTEDKITLRVNLSCQYKNVDPMIIHNIKDHFAQLYIFLQMVIREYLSTLKLDEFLQKKQEIGEFVLQKLSQKSETLGVKFINVGLRDVILPGEIRDILNYVLIAEKKAQANIITRREETASTRSLLNTAKMMEDNPTLLRLKEMEYIEKISEKIHTISLSSNANVLDQMLGILKK
ncbi:MAG: slipin family protein [Leptospiraceae bacterium]|nr:slipin family protein [Leptospiraceae bacterium]